MSARSVLDEDNKLAPAEPWPFPPIHVMPTGPNGTAVNHWHCVRCGAVLRLPNGLNRTSYRCPEFQTIGGRVGQPVHPKMSKYG